MFSWLRKNKSAINGQRERVRRLRQMYRSRYIDSIPHREVRVLLKPYTDGSGVVY